MPNDIWYGGDCETRIGRRPDLNTAPASWQAIEFLSLTVNPSQEWRPRNKLGNPGIRKNVLDPTRPRKGFFRLTAELVLDADTRQLAIWLRYAMGAPVVSTEIEEGVLYEHAFESGSKAEQYFDLAIKVGEGDVRLYEGLTLSQISTQFTGENTQDFNVNISLAGLRRKKVAAFPAGTVTVSPAEAPVLRAIFKIDNTAADSMLSGSFSYGRTLQEGIYLSPTVNVSSLRANGGQHSGSVSYRAIGADLDIKEEGETPFEASFDLLGVIQGHKISLQHPQALLAPSPLPIEGPGAIERTINWAPYQTAVAAAARIVITNEVEQYS